MDKAVSGATRQASCRTVRGVPLPAAGRLLMSALLLFFLALDVWAQTEKDELATAQARAEAMLEKLSTKADKRTLKMLKDLEHRSPEKRAEAAEFLGDLEVAEAAPGLAVRLSDSSAPVRVAASRALWQIGKPGAEPARSALGGALASDTDGRVRINAAGALWALGASTDELVPHLQPVLEDDRGYTRVRAANLLQRMGTAGATLVGVYADAMGDRNDELRLFTIRSLLDLDEKPREFTPVVLSALRDSDDVVRTLAATWLHVVGDPTAEVIAALRVAAGDRSASVRSAALDALAAAGVEATGDGDGSTEAALLAGLRDRKADVRASAADGLGEIRASSPAAVQALIGALSDPDDTVRAAAADALGEIGEPARSAIPRLQALWDDRSLYFTVRHAAGRALGKLGSPVDWSTEG